MTEQKEQSQTEAALEQALALIKSGEIIANDVVIVFVKKIPQRGVHFSWLTSPMTEKNALAILDISTMQFAASVELKERLESLRNFSVRKN